MIEKAHDHQLEMGKDEPPRDAVDALRRQAHNFEENYIVDYVHGLDVIVNANAESEYYQCDIELRIV